MNACLAENFSVYQVDHAPVQSRQKYRVRTDDLTPAQRLLKGRNDSLLEAAVSALEEAMSEERVYSIEAFSDLAMLLQALPQHLPETEAHISASGSLCFDWDEDPENQLSIILQGNGRIAFAAYFAGDRVHGTARFRSQLPEELEAAANKWLAYYRHVAVRAA